MRLSHLIVPSIAVVWWGAITLVACGGVSIVTPSDGGGGVSGNAGAEGGAAGGTGGSSDAGDDLASDSVTATDGVGDAAGRGDSSAGAAGTAGSSAGAAGSAGSSAGTIGTSADAGGDAADTTDSAGAAGTSGVVTSCVNQTDGTPCDDANTCTAQSSCSGGTCLGATPNETIAAHELTLSCPLTETAVNGMVNHTCDFPDTLSPNNVYTGNVTLVSHFDRIFANSDINPLGDGRVQLMCFYENAGGTGIGAISRSVVATSCTATSYAGFTCTR
jgi:hypothetical protein